MDYPSSEISFHPEMRGKCWIKIIRNHSFHKFLHSIGMFCFILDSKGSDCNIERILAVLNTYLYRFTRLRKLLQKNTKNGLLSCHSCNTCVIRTRHRFRLINVLHRFFSVLNAAHIIKMGCPHWCDII